MSTPTMQCDACGKIVPRDQIKSRTAYGIEGDFCRTCRHEEPEEEDEPCACVIRYMDYAGVMIPITDRCPQHQAEREARQREDALSWPRIINRGER